MRASRALPRRDNKLELERLWKTLKKEPPGKIVSVKSKVVTRTDRQNGHT